MTDRTYINICLLASVIPIQELWNLWPQDFTINPWLQSGPDIGIWWYVKGLSNSLVEVILAILIFRLSRMHYSLRIASSVFLVYRLTDLWLYIKNYNNAADKTYFIAYSFAPVFIILFAYVKKQRSPYQQRELFKEKEQEEPVL